MNFDMVRPGMVLRYVGNNKKILRSCKPAFPKDAPIQRVCIVDKVLPTGGVVVNFPVETLSEEGEVSIKHVGGLVNSQNLTETLDKGVVSA